MHIAALLTSHNRRTKTLVCLQSLLAFAPEVDVYLTDDGCTDGTAVAVREAYPQIHIVPGDGNLYWNRGMHRAWTEALRGDYDYYLWLNDDVVLYPHFLQSLLACCPQGDALVCGLIEEAQSHAIIYGGCDRHKRLVGCSEAPQQLYWINGNVVLVPRRIVAQVGILDPYFIHDLGDVDYGMRVREAGFKVLSTPCAVGSGVRNDVCRVRRWNASLVGRFRQLHKPLGSPLSRNYHFRRRHFGVMHALAYNAKIILLNLLPDWLVVRIWGDLYVDRIG